MKDLSSHMMDIVQNSIRAEASWIQIRICEDPEADLFLIEIQDNGCGMDEATLARVRDPFFTSRTVRKVGLGIPLLQQNAERTGGKVSLTAGSRDYSHSPFRSFPSGPSSFGRCSRNAYAIGSRQSGHPFQLRSFDSQRYIPVRYPRDHTGAGRCTFGTSRNSSGHTKFNPGESQRNTCRSKHVHQAIIKSIIT